MIEQLTLMMIVQNEEDIVLNPIKQLYDYVKDIVILDGGSIDGTIDVLKDFKNEYDKQNKLRLFVSPFNGHFGDQRNKALEKVKTEWTISLDADETLDEATLPHLEEYINKKEFQAYKIPRLNTIDGEKTDTWPDYQVRLYRTYLRWVYCIHEELVGYKKIDTFKDEHFIHHHKSRARQDKQDKLYSKLEKKYEYLSFKEDKENKDE